MKIFKNGMVWVWITTCYLLVYTLLIASDTGLNVDILMFAFSTVLIIFMAIRVLKDEYTTNKTFDEYWYEDRSLKKS